MLTFLKHENSLFQGNHESFNTTDANFTDSIDNTIIQWSPSVFLLLGVPLRVFHFNGGKSNHGQLWKFSTFKVVSIT